MLKNLFNNSKALLPASIGEDLAAIDERIHQELASKAPLTTEVANYIINAGGKRLRPLLVLLVARALGYAGENHRLLATMIEFIHTASLLHDDVVDEASLRRGKPSANRAFGNAASVLVGDFLHTRAFQLMLSVNNLDVMKVVAKATNQIAEGEVLQLMKQHEIAVTEEEYMAIISAKTARLFEAASQIGAIISTDSENLRQAAKSFGYDVGCAFQMIDDCLDYGADASSLGKVVGQDLKEGKMTLPLIFVMKNGTSTQKEMIKQYIQNEKKEYFQAIFDAVKSSEALAYGSKKAADFAQKAIQTLESFPQNEYKACLLQLCEFIVARKF